MHASYYCLAPQPPNAQEGPETALGGVNYPKEVFFKKNLAVGSVQSVQPRERPEAVGQEKVPGSNPGGATFRLKLSTTHRD